MRRRAQTFPIPAPVLKPATAPWDQQAPQVVQDSEDRRASKVNRVRRDQKVLGVKLALQDLRVPPDHKDQVVCLSKECLGCQAKKGRKERLAHLVRRASQEVSAHRDAMALPARGAFLERMGPLALQDHQGQLAYPEPPESQGSPEA